MLLPSLFTSLYIQVPKSSIALLRFILEGYDHLATMTVINPKRGLIKLHFPSAEEQTIREILSDFQVTYISEEDLEEFLREGL